MYLTPQNVLRPLPFLELAIGLSMAYFELSFTIRLEPNKRVENNEQTQLSLYSTKKVCQLIIRIKIVICKNNFINSRISALKV